MASKMPANEGLLFTQLRLEANDLLVDGGRFTNKLRGHLAFANADHGRQTLTMGMTGNRGLEI